MASVRQSAEMQPQITRGPECLLFGPPLCFAGKAAHQLVEHVECRVDESAFQPHNCNGQHGVPPVRRELAKVLRRHAQAFLSQAFAYRWWDGRFAGTVKPEGTDRMSTLDEREEVSGSRRLRRSPQPGKKGQRRAGPAVKQLVEHAPMLIAHPGDDSSMTDT